MAPENASNTVEQTPPLQGNTTLPNIDPELTARATLSLLETRLRRVEFLLTGVSDYDGRPIGPKSTTTSATLTTQLEAEQRSPQDENTVSTLADGNLKKPSTIPAQIASLEASLAKLKRLDGVAGNLIRSVDTLYKRNPEIFSTMITTRSQVQRDSSAGVPEKAPAPHETLHKSSVVLSQIPAFHSHSSQLQTLTTLPIPPAAHSTSLINAAPRVKALREKQQQLEQEARELQERSARALEWWVKVGVVAMGEVWEEWEARVEQSERAVRRMERRRREETGV